MKKIICFLLFFVLAINYQVNADTKDDAANEFYNLINKIEKGNGINASIALDANLIDSDDNSSIPLNFNSNIIIDNNFNAHITNTFYDKTILELLPPDVSYDEFYFDNDYIYFKYNNTWYKIDPYLIQYLINDIDNEEYNDSEDNIEDIDNEEFNDLEDNIEDVDNEDFNDLEDNIEDVIIDNDFEQYVTNINTDDIISFFNNLENATYTKDNNDYIVTGRINSDLLSKYAKGFGIDDQETINEISSNQVDLKISILNSKSQIIFSFTNLSKESSLYQNGFHLNSLVIKLTENNENVIIPEDVLNAIDISSLMRLTDNEGRIIPSTGSNLLILNTFSFILLLTTSIIYKRNY
ncbi:MAG: hypothetical protein LBR40_02625 [Bacilli bacterium]|jgi:hypothetical protein|nr:hypothetical protein [Bacilli bacterium]